MYIETALATALSRSTKPSIQQTGSLQSVLQESISIAYSFAKVFMTKRFPRNGFFDRAQIHVHLPEGAIPKDGIHTSRMSLADFRSICWIGTCLCAAVTRS
jgi:ATP-dependent Lon protease